LRKKRIAFPDVDRAGVVNGSIAAAVGGEGADAEFLEFLANAAHDRQGLLVGIVVCKAHDDEPEIVRHVTDHQAGSRSHAAAPVDAGDEQVLIRRRHVVKRSRHGCGCAASFQFRQGDDVITHGRWQAKDFVAKLHVVVGLLLLKNLVVVAKALGNETGRPTLVLDMGALYSSLVGATEANVRQALRIADAMAPCILFTDELDKGLAGVGGQGDSGVSTRLFGTLLTWLAEHESDVFFIGTANDISKLPPEFTRAERLDGVFFLDVPTVAEKDAIWKMYRQRFDIPEQQSRPEDVSWTGAEIRSCCRLAALLDVTLFQAAQHVVPVSVTAAESMEKLRTWASGRCLSASQPGIYSRDGGAISKPGRRLRRDPSDN
jgi:hypothetical protein